MRRITQILSLFVFVLWAHFALATVTTTYLKSGPYNTDGSTTVFAISFQYIADSDLTAALVNNTTGATTVLVLNSDFTVDDGPAGSDGTFNSGTIVIQPNAGGNIANGSGQFPAGYKLTISRAMLLTQDQSYPYNGAFPSAATEQALDRITLIAQQQQNQLNGAIQIPTSDNGINVTLPTSVARANKYLAFDSSGNATASNGTGGISTINGTSPLTATTTGTTSTVAIGSAVPATLGGTGQTTLTSGAVIIGNGASAVTVLSPSNGSCLVGAGGAWAVGSCSGTSNMTLGSTTTTNPQVSGDVTTGFLTPAASTVAVQTAAHRVMQWNNLASGVDYATVTPGKSGTAVTIGVAGATSSQNLNLTPASGGNVQINGVAYPNSVTNNNVMASTASAVVNESVSTLLDNGIGSTSGAVLARTTTGWAPLVGTTTGDALTWNGSAWVQGSAANTINVQPFTASGSGTWNKPAYGTLTKAECWGGGASGGHSSGASLMGGGGGGDYNYRWYQTSALGSTETVSIGAGGASASSAGNSGGNSTFSSSTNLLTAYGGAGGQAQFGGGGGGALSAGSTSTGGSPLASTSTGADNPGIGGANGGGVGNGGNSGSGGAGGGGVGGSGNGGNSMYGGAGGGGGNGTTSGGTSAYGGAGGAGTGTNGVNGTAGTQPGGGGGACGTGAGGGGSCTTGAGATGECIISTFP